MSHENKAEKIIDALKQGASLLYEIADAAFDDGNRRQKVEYITKVLNAAVDLPLLNERIEESLIRAVVDAVVPRKQP